jgi:hypothetical protein
VKRGGDCGRFSGMSVEAVVEVFSALEECPAAFLCRRGRDSGVFAIGLVSSFLAGRDLVWVRVTGGMLTLPYRFCVRKENVPGRKNEFVGADQMQRTLHRLWSRGSYRYASWSASGIASSIRLVAYRCDHARHGSCDDQLD